jgi:phosphatidylglycerophosphatase A
MNFYRAVASFGGVGFSPYAPGTMGSLAALVPGAVLLTQADWVLPLAILVVTLAGVWATHVAAGDADPGWVVIDEVAGQWMALLPLSAPTPLGLVAAFALFRLLDITKPGPVGWADRQKGAAGVMGDDLIAGVIAAGILWALQSRYPGILDLAWWGSARG